VNAPDVVIAAPAGIAPAPASSVNVSVSAGMSASDAVAVKDNSTSSSVTWFPIGSRIGATLTSLTVTVISSESDSVPSDTTTSNV